MKMFSLASVMLLLALSCGAVAANSTAGQISHPTRTQSEGGPIATCRPGNPNCNPNDNVRVMASEGGPIATCRPGNPNCNPNDNVRVMRLSRSARIAAGWNRRTVNLV